MPRRLKNEVVEETAPQTASPVAPSAYPPFEGETKGLPSPVFYAGEGTKRGPTGAILKVGDPRFYLRPIPNGLELIRIYRNGKGVRRLAVRSFKTVPMGSPGSAAKVRAHKVILDKLYASGIRTFPY